MAPTQRYGIWRPNHPVGKGGDLMTRGFPSRPVLSAALVVALLASVSLTAFVAPISAAPSQEAASSSVTTSHSVIGPADEGPTGHFAFSVLDQASTTQTKAVGGG